MSKTSREQYVVGSKRIPSFNQQASPTSSSSMAEATLLFSQLSLRTTSNPQKVIFKISYNGDKKRIP